MISRCIYKLLHIIRIDFSVESVERDVGRENLTKHGKDKTFRFGVDLVSRDRD